jgi:hypothetical protein
MSNNPVQGFSIFTLHGTHDEGIKASALPLQAMHPKIFRGNAACKIINVMSLTGAGI